MKEHSGAYQLLAMRAGYLEQENLQLQHSMELLGKQKTSLEKTLRQIKLAQHADVSIRKINSEILESTKEHR